MRLRSCKNATLVNSCFANFWMWELGKGTKPLDLRKSKTLWPYKSVTMQMWFRKSKQSRRCIHRLMLCLSLEASVDSTRNSMRLASRYFGTERITLMAHFVPFLLSQASTTLPKVPWPRSFKIWSVQTLALVRRKRWMHTSLSEVGLRYYDVVAILVVNFLVFVARLLLCCQ